MEPNPSPNERLLALSREMFECAKAGDWDQLTALERSRLSLFNQIFGQGISGNVGLAREVLSIDEKTKNLAEAHLPVLQQEILTMNTSGKANAAYQAIQNSTSGND